MKRLKQAFTLTELLIVLGVASVIAALTVPVIVQSTDNIDNTLYKSAFKLVESTVNELVSDPSVYPTGTLDSNFCTNFSNKTNTIGSTTCTASTIVPDAPNFVTSNGMRWYQMEGGFTTDPKVIKVDINGTKTPNKDNQDILTISVYSSGKVTTTGTTEKGYLQN